MYDLHFSYSFAVFLMNVYEYVWLYACKHVCGVSVFVNAYRKIVTHIACTKKKEKNILIIIIIIIINTRFVIHFATNGNDKWKNRLEVSCSNCVAARNEYEMYSIFPIYIIYQMAHTYSQIDSSSDSDFYPPTTSSSSFLFVNICSNL